MDVDDSDIPERLANPYRSSDSRQVVWGVTLGRVGAVTAGVVAVVAPAGGSGAFEVDGGGHTVTASSEVLLGTGDDVHHEIAELSMPAGYLWPSPQLPDPPVSPALEL